MTNEQILKKAIEKAIKNGLKIEQSNPSDAKYVATESQSIRGAVFSHDFAKAFVRYILSDSILTIYLFKDSEKIEKYSKAGIIEEMAKDIFLAEMVLEKEPLKYIEKFL